MADHDELHQLWRCPAGCPSMKGEVMLALAMQKAHRFDRMIQMRNTFECAVALVMAAVFGRWAWHAPNTLTGVGRWVVAASMLWIVYYLLRYGREAAPPNPDQTLVAFQQALLGKYDHQIRLLRSVKYWYLLPPYAGLLLISAGMLSDLVAAHLPMWPVSLAVAAYTLLFGALWWLNEIKGVQRLQRDRARLLEEMESAAL